MKTWPGKDFKSYSNLNLLKFDSFKSKEGAKEFSCDAQLLLYRS